MEHIRKPQILQAAAEVIGERGLAGTRVADVAERAGTSPAAVLYWFGGREELLNEALRSGEESFYESVMARLKDLAGPGERLRLLLEASADDYDWTLWMELWTRALRDPQARETRQRLDDRWRKEIAQHVREGQEDGDFSSTHEPEQVALVLASLVDGLALQTTLGDAAVPPERMRQLSLESAERLLGRPLPEIDHRPDDRGHEMLVEGGRG
jgi:AcrR family transcriptional regulator